MVDASSAETEPHTVVELLPTAISAKETLVAYAAPTTAPSPDIPILFLPQNPSSEGFIIAEPGTPAHSSLGSEPAPANNTSDQPPATGGVSTPLMMAYYPGWVADTFPPERIEFSRFDWIDYAFAEPDENFALSQEGFNTLSRLVSVAHHNGKKVKLSVGGWDGSQ
jgi:chitinase